MQRRILENYSQWGGVIFCTTLEKVAHACFAIKAQRVELIIKLYVLVSYISIFSVERKV
jgi:hypothetical protein